MVPEDDWRRNGQEEYLQGAVFVWRPFHAVSAEWDHDHCEFCWAKCMVSDSPGTLPEGWATPYNGRSDAFRWVCPSCFDDFGDEFGFVIGPEVTNASSPPG
jgi:hypothetical protein